MDSGEGNSLPTIGGDGSKRRVCYFYDPEIGNYYYGHGHAMKPYRIRVTDTLLREYGLMAYMDVYRPDPASRSDLCCFHRDEYIDFLRNPTVPGAFDDRSMARQNPFGISHRDDCPVFDGLYEYCQSYAGASIGAAKKLNDGDHDIAINWSGGLHHSKCGEASGFCYVNDIVLAILKLLENHQRVLYIDIDIHHGDGVEEAFYTTDRVMTVSFHKFGNYFPRTGDIRDIGCGKGKYYAVNVPFEEGTNDASFQFMFKPIISKVMTVYSPSAVVLQCGADSLSGDPVGCFNLSIKGHAECVRFLRSFNVPLMLLGGGGYSIRNVARCWCYETAVALGKEIKDKMPQHNYIGYFSPEYTLHESTSNKENKNSQRVLDKVRVQILENISKLQHVPSVQFQERVIVDDQEDEIMEEDEDKDLCYDLVE